MPLILDNNFSRDTHGLRTERLAMLAANADLHKDTIGLSAELAAWAADAKDRWLNALAAANLERGQRDIAFETYRQKLNAAIDFYQRQKDFLLMKIENDSQNRELAEALGIFGRTPSSLGDFLEAVKKMTSANAQFLAENLPYTITAAKAAELTAMANEVLEAWQRAKSERKDTAEAYDEVQRIFDEDTKNLRMIYSHAVYTWGKANPLLEDLGFAPLVPRTGGGRRVNIPTNLRAQHDSGATFTILWDAVENATSYQLAFREQNAQIEQDWEELYAGDATSAVFTAPAAGRSYEFRVRARNANGYGDWSPVLNVVVAEG